MHFVAQAGEASTRRCQRPLQCCPEQPSHGWLQSQTINTGSQHGRRATWMNLLLLLRMMRTERDYICWYSLMQIHAVGWTHTSALIHSSRLSLSFRKLVCSTGLWPCRSSSASPCLVLHVFIKLVHGRKQAKSPKVAVLCVLMDNSRGLLRPSLSNTATRELGQQPSTWKDQKLIQSCY